LTGCIAPGQRGVLFLAFGDVALSAGREISLRRRDFPRQSVPRDASACASREDRFGALHGVAALAVAVNAGKARNE
jgi:hypothetical protein